jgi:hypothetical protein
MNKRAWVVAFGAAVALSGCAGGATDGPVADGGNAPAAGSLDCSAIDSEKLALYGLYAQLFPQITTVDDVSSLEFVDYSAEQFDDALDMLEPVRGLGAGQFGDPGQALDFYRTTNAAAAELVAKGDAVTQADVDAFVAQAGGMEAMVENQLAINAPLSDACPDLD